MSIMTRGLIPAASAITLALALLAMPAQAEEDSFFTHLHAEKAMANVTVSLGELLRATLGNAENGVAPVTVKAERIGDDRWMVRMSAPKAGRWSLALAIAISANDTVNVESPILLR